MTQPLVVIVILTCNQKQVTLDCLKSLSCCTYENYQVILVDNGSRDGVRESVERLHPAVIVLRNEDNLGAAGGRNTAIEYAAGNIAFTYMLFMDNDVVVQQDFLEKLVYGLESCSDSRVEIASPKLYRMGRGKVIDSAGGALLNFYTGTTRTRGFDEIDNGQYDHDPFPPCVPTTVTVLLHRRALSRAHRFDIAYDPYGYEDLDMILRANPKRHPYLFVSDAVVHHLGSKTGFSGYTTEYTRMKGKNMRRFFKRHSTPFQWFCFNMILPILASRTVVRELRRGNLKAVWSLAKGFLRGT